MHTAPLTIDPVTGLVPGVRQVISPHCDSRPAGVVADLIVVHGISLPPGDFRGPWIERLFCGNLPADAHPYFETIAAARVSAHLLIRRDGALLQFVPFHRRAWHAGASSYAGRSSCNDFSVGIELEGSDDLPYDAPQYTALVAVLRALFVAYPAFTADRLVGHSDIAPGRKTDPGPSFDWSRLRTLLKEGEQQ